MDKFASFAFAVIGIGFLILIHELGHFKVARWLKFTVQEFSIGFGPKLFSWVGRNGVLYCVRYLFLFGGFVRIKEIEQDLLEEPQTLKARPIRDILRRVAVIAAGPTVNFLAAFLLFFIYSFWMAGLKGSSEIASVQEGGPAAQAGLRPGDELVGFGNFKRAKLSEVVCYIRNHPEKPIRLWVRRDFEYFPVLLIPRRVTEYLLIHDPSPDSSPFRRVMERVFGRVEKRWRGLIGVTFKMEPIPGGISFPERFSEAISLTLGELLFAWHSITVVFTHPILFRELAGPIRITYEFVANRWQGIMKQIEVLGIISFAVAFLNLLPIPLLDGGRILFLFVELLSRRRFYRLEVKATYIGLAFIIALAIFVVFKDLHFLLTQAMTRVAGG